MEMEEKSKKMTKSILSEHDQKLVDACKSPTNNLDAVIAHFECYVPLPNGFKPNVEFLAHMIGRCMEIYRRVTIDKHFVDMVSYCYKDDLKFFDDERCNRDSEVGVLFAHLKYWVTKVAWLNLSCFLEGYDPACEYDEFEEIKTESIMIELGHKILNESE